MYKRRRHSIGWICMILNCWSVVALCQSTGNEQLDSTTHVYRMEEVVVSASVSGFIPPVSIALTQEQIRERGKTTIADILRHETGLTLTSGSKAETEFRIRAFPANSTLVLLDGHPINSGYYGKVDLSLLALEPVASVTVLKGPSSVAFGPNAMGGVLSIVTKQGRNAPYTTLDAEAGTLSHRRLGLHHGNRVDRVHYALTLYEQSRAGFPLSKNFEATSLEDGGTRNNSVHEMYGGQFRFGYDRSETESYSLHVGLHEARRDVPTTVYSWDTPTFRRFPRLHRINASISGRRDVGASAHASVLLFADTYGDNLVEYKSAAFDAEEIAFDSQLDNISLGGSFALRSGLFEKHDIGAGVHFKQDIIHRLPDVHTNKLTHRATTASAFIEDVLRPWKRAVITLGLSQTYFAHPESPVTSWRLCPMFGITQSMPWNIHASAGISRVVRYPTSHQLYSQSSGNPDLLPEEAWKLEAGVSRDFPVFSRGMVFGLEFTVHRSELTNLIHRGSRSFRYENYASSRLQGAEVKATASLAQTLDLNASYEHLVLDDKSALMMHNIAKHTFRCSAQLRLPYGVGLRYEFLSFDDRTTYLPNYILPGYTIHNIAASIPILHSISLRLRAVNLTDKYYQEEVGYPATGRMLFVGVSWKQ